MGHVLKRIASIALPIAGTFLGGPIGGAIGGGLGSAVNGGSIGQDLLGAGLGGLGAGLSGAGGALVPADSFLGGINSGITDAFSPITSGLSNFADSTGLSQLFGGTASPSGDLTSAYNNLSAVPEDAASNAASANNAVNFAPGGVSSSYTAAAAAPGNAGIGGGTLSGFGGGSGIGESTAIGSSLGSGPTGAFSDFGSGIGAAQSQPSFLSGLFNPSQNAGTFNYDINGLPAGASSYSIPQQFAQAATPAASTGGNMLSSLFSGNGSGMTNGLLKAGLGYLLNNNNASGLKSIQNASNQAQANFAPYLAAGSGAENTLSNLYGNNGTAAQTAAMQNFQTSPGYQFALQQGLNAINANNAATGQTLSGNAQEGINNYAQGVASQQYNNYINQLQNLASGGMSAAGGAGTARLTGAGARAQLGQNNANNANNALGAGLSALFPTNINLAQLFGGNNSSAANGGLLSLF